MSGTYGNTNAKGNSGGKPYSEENRGKAATLKGLVLDEAVKIMRSKSQSKEMKFKRMKVMEKILPTCIPRELDIGNKDNTPFEIFVNDDQKNKIAERIIGRRKSSS